jgi:8-oxo-dGTP diphosphatase
MERFRLIPEVHLLLLRQGQILLLQRQNTGFEDGNWSVIAGHVEGREPARVAMAREAWEEAGLRLDPQSLALVHLMHRRSDDERVSFFFRAERWRGEPVNREPQKCGALAWFALDALPANMVGYVRQGIELALAREVYSEFGWERGVRLPSRGA